MGIATSAQFSVSKLYNDPLLKTTTSLVAGKSGDDLKAAVSTAISSAALIGSMQGLVFLLFSGRIMDILGVSTSSAMRIPAMSYLKWRSLGIPASTVLLVTNGIFRGRGDTKTPLYCTLAGNLANIMLDPILIFGCHMGCAGAAAALSISQWLAAVPLLYLLHKSIPFDIYHQDTSRLAYAFSNYFRAGTLILFRTIAKISAYTVTASAAARLGTVPMAAYSLTFSLGFTSAQLCESVAIAAQAFLARDMPFDTKEKQAAARHVIVRSLQIGAVISLGLISTILWNMDSLLARMTSSPEVRAAASAVMPIVLFAQIIKGISSSTGSILLGGCDWVWSTLSMKMAAAICIGLIFLLPPSLQSIWIALTAFMSTQVRRHQSIWIFRSR
jgi:putative MATE family efflux protein